MMIAVPFMHVMQGTINEKIEMVAVSDPLMPTAVTMKMLLK